MNFVKNTVHMPYNLYGRMAHRFVQCISELKSDVYILKSDTDNSPINAKSLLGVLSAQIKMNDNVVISCNNEKRYIAEGDMSKIVQMIARLGDVDE